MPRTCVFIRYGRPETEAPARGGRVSAGHGDVAWGEPR